MRRICLVLLFSSLAGFFGCSRQVNDNLFREFVNVQGDTSGTRSLKWLSSEWNSLLVKAAEEAGRRRMLTDLIVGSGWLLGGEFLKESEIIQRVI